MRTLHRGLACCFAACLAALAWAGAAMAGEKTFATQRACEQGGLVSEIECKYAFLNADAELDEKAPRFATRGECERQFRRCVIAGIGRTGANGKISGVVFQPGMRAVDIVVRGDSDKSVRPLIEMGDIPGLGARTILRQDVERSPQRRAQALARWRQIEAQKTMPAGGGGQDRRANSDESLSDEPAPSGAEPNSVPVRADVWQEMQRDMHKYGSGD